jgi:hypothetical protein
VYNVANNSIRCQCSEPLNDIHNDVSLLFEEGSQNGKTQAQTNVKDVRKASNPAKRINNLEHRIKAAPVIVLDPKPRHSIHMSKVLANAANISSETIWKQMTSYL